MDSEFVELLNAKIAGCTACRLHQGRTQTVPGDGDPNAELMFIGEAPGANEDKIGRPFVGRAGQLLDDLLAEIGFTRPEVFVANVVKCRPPENRNPQADEIGCCEVYLREQIEGIRPKLIVLLGLFATQYFLPDARIGQVRGQPHQTGPWLVLPVYHPAAILRNPSLREVTQQDFALIRPLLAQSERPPQQPRPSGHSHGPADDDSQRSLL